MKNKFRIPDFWPPGLSSGGFFDSIIALHFVEIKQTVRNNKKTAKEKAFAALACH
jgi:hypothetical protein